MSEPSQVISRLKQLANKIDAAEKARAQSKPDLAKKIEEALKLAEEINWQEFVTELRNECESHRTRHEENLKALVGTDKPRVLGSVPDPTGSAGILTSRPHSLFF